MEKPRIMVVEDEPIISMDICGVLESLGFGVAASVSSGEDAVRTAGETKPDLILMDILLGEGMDGIEAARRIREQQDIPIVYLTAHADVATVARARDAQPYGYVLKPVQHNDLYTTVDAALHRHRLEGDLRIKNEELAAANQELQAALEELETTNEEMASAQDELVKLNRRLQIREEKYRDLAENIVEAVYETDENGILTYVSPMVEATCSYSPEEMLGRLFVEIIYPEDQESFKKTIGKISRGESRSGECRIVTKSGDVRWIHLSGRPKFEKGRFAGFRGAIMDVTERMRAEMRLKEKDERLAEANNLMRLVLDTIPVRIFWKDRDLNYLGCNRLFAADAGYGAPEELVGKSDFDLGWREQAELYRRDDAEIIATGKEKINYEEQETTSRGDRIWLRTSKTPLRDVQGEIIGVLGTYEDITESKKIEGELSESRQNLHSLFNTIDDLVLVLYADGSILDANSAVCRVLGYSMKELRGKSYVHLNPGDRRDEAEAVLGDMLSGKVESSMVPLRSKDGTLVHAETRVTRGSWGGTPVLFAVARDITGRVKAEEALKMSEQKYRLLVDNSLVGIGVSQDQAMVFCNQRFAEMFGYPSPREVLGLHLDRIVAPESLEFVTSLVGSRPSRKRRAVHYEMKALRRDGSVFDAEVFGGIIDYEGKSASQGMVIDITERKSVEAAVRRSEEKYRSLLDSINGIFFSVSSEGIVTFVSGGITNVLKMTPEELVGKPFTEIIYPPDLHAVVEDFNRTMGGDQHPFEYRLSDKDGAGRWVRSYSHVVGDRGRPEGLNGILIDINDRKEIEEALKESEERYRALFDRSFDAVYVNDLVGNFLDANDAALKLMGYSREEIPNLNFAALLTEDQIPKALKVLQEEIEFGSMREAGEFRVRRKDGEFIWIETMAAVITRDGSPVASLAVARNVTERKRAEEGLRASLTEKEVLLQELHHRVKNNFQVILSLLSLQSNRTENGEVRMHLADAHNRIMAMAVVHEDLYSVGELAKINFQEYLGLLARGVMRSYLGDSDKISLSVDAGSVILPVDRAIPCCLVVNELITNALKHAFPGGMEGRIEVTLRPLDGGGMELTVRDSGVGLPPDLEPDKAGSLGMQLVHFLIRDQMKGQVRFERGAGTAAVITF